MSGRTIDNRLTDVGSFLHANGIELSLHHAYTEKKVSAYRPDELRRLFAAATPDEWLMLQFFLCSGGREQEVMYAEWESIDFVDRIGMCGRPSRSRPRTTRSGRFRCLTSRIDALRQRMLATKGTLIFPNGGGAANGHMLRQLQALTKRAGLPGDWGLHKWRKPYATLQHKAGVDARTIQKRLGHSDLSTTLAYLEGEDARSERSRTLINGTFKVFA